MEEAWVIGEDARKEGRGAPERRGPRVLNPAWIFGGPVIVLEWPLRISAPPSRQQVTGPWGLVSAHQRPRGAVEGVLIDAWEPRLLLPDPFTAFS